MTFYPYGPIQFLGATIPPGISLRQPQHQSVTGAGREVSDRWYAVALLQSNSQDLCYSPRFVIRWG